MNILYRFNDREGQTCENCGFALGATSYLLLGKGVNPGPYAAQNGTLCAECVLLQLGSMLGGLLVRRHAKKLEG